MQPFQNATSWHISRGMHLSANQMKMALAPKTKLLCEPFYAFKIIFR